MYGYVRIDKGSLPAAQARIYYAHFCGLCKTAGRRHGQLSRFLIGYDAAFLDIFTRGICGAKTEIREESCIASLRKKRGIALKNGISELITDVSVLLGFYKLSDDIFDGGGFKRRLMRRGIFRAYKRAKRAHRPLEGQIKALYEKLRICERAGEANLDAVSHNFGTMLSAAGEYILRTQKCKECLPPSTVKVASEFFYNLGKWVYIVDAADDLLEDKKSGNYNPLLCGVNLDSARFAASCAASRVAECLEKLPLKEGREILGNIIYKGLLSREDKVFSKGENDNG